VVHDARKHAAACMAVEAASAGSDSSCYLMIEWTVVTTMHKTTASKTDSHDKGLGYQPGLG